MMQFTAKQNTACSDASSCVFSIIGLLVLLVLAWGLVNGMLLIMMYKLKNAKSDRIWIPEAA